MARRCLRVTCQSYMKVASTPFFGFQRASLIPTGLGLFLFSALGSVLSDTYAPTAFLLTLNQRQCQWSFLVFDMTILSSNSPILNLYGTSFQHDATFRFCNPRKFSSPHVQAIFQGFPMNVPQNITKSRWCSKPQYRNILATPVFLDWGRFLHPRRLTWNIIMEVWKIIFLSKWVICRFHVNLPGCKPHGKIAEKPPSARVLKIGGLPDSGRLQA